MMVVMSETSLLCFQSFQHEPHPALRRQIGRQHSPVFISAVSASSMSANGPRRSARKTTEDVADKNRGRYLGTPTTGPKGEGIKRTRGGRWRRRFWQYQSSMYQSNRQFKKQAIELATNMSSFTIDSIYEIIGRQAVVIGDGLGIGQIICQGFIANASTRPSWISSRTGSMRRCVCASRSRKRRARRRGHQQLLRRRDTLINCASIRRQNRTSFKPNESLEKLGSAAAKGDGRGHDASSASHRRGCAQQPVCPDVPAFEGVD